MVGLGRRKWRVWKERIVKILHGVSNDEDVARSKGMGKSKWKITNRLKMGSWNWKEEKYKRQSGRNEIKKECITRKDREDEKEGLVVEEVKK